MIATLDSGGNHLRDWTLHNVLSGTSQFLDAPSKADEYLRLRRRIAAIKRANDSAGCSHVRAENGKIIEINGIELSMENMFTAVNVARDWHRCHVLEFFEALTNCSNCRMSDFDPSKLLVTLFHLSKHPASNPIQLLC